jgi:hypothetical protein
MTEKFHEYLLYKSSVISDITSCIPLKVSGFSEEHLTSIPEDELSASISRIFFSLVLQPP